MTKSSVEPNKAASTTSLFFTMGLDMSWRLALSVLIPIIGGVELDKVLNSSPWLLMVGLALAVACAVVTIRRTLRLSNQITFPTNPNKENKTDA